MSNDITWTAVEYVRREPEGVYWLSLSSWGDCWEARFRPNGDPRTPYVRIEPLSDDDGLPLESQTLPAAQRLCQQHLEALRAKGASHAA